MTTTAMMKSTPQNMSKKRKKKNNAGIKIATRVNDITILKKTTQPSVHVCE